MVPLERGLALDRGDRRGDGRRATLVPAVLGQRPRGRGQPRPARRGGRLRGDRRHARHADPRLARRATCASRTSRSSTGEGCAQFFTDPVFRSRLAQPPEEDVLAAAAAMLATFPNLRLTWDDLAWLRGLTELPLLVKGVLTAEDAQRARRARRRRDRRLQPRRPPGRRRRSRRWTRSSRFATAVGRGRGGADGQRHPPRRGRAQGAGAGRGRGPARPAVRLRPRGRRPGRRRDRDPPPDGGHRLTLALVGGRERP